MAGSVIRFYNLCVVCVSKWATVFGLFFSCELNPKVKSSVMSPLTWCLVVLAVVSPTTAAWFDTFTGNQITDERTEALRAQGMIPYCAIEVRECNANEPRRADYSCNNLNYPPRGAILTPYHRMLPPDYAADGGPRVSKSGNELPNARALRVSLLTDGRVPNKKFTHMLTNMNVFLVSDVTSVHDTVNYVALTTTCCAPGGDSDPRCIPIKVEDDDLHLRRSNVRCLNLTRAITYQRLGCVPDTLPAERVNTAPPMLELSHVYQGSTETSRKLREMEGGRLRSEVLKGKEWPLSGSPFCVNNQLNETRCHAAYPGSNSLLGINLLFIWFFRNHNEIARRLQAVNPCWDDDKLYTVAKDINIAAMQHIMYYELMAAIIGEDYLVKNRVIFPGHGHVEDYDPRLEPRVSLEYVMSARWFHVMQEGRINLYDPYGKMFGQLSVVDMTLRTGLLPRNNTLEGCTQGAFRQACASNDYVIDPDMGERSLGRLQLVSDVMSADIMKNRDVGLPAYNRYRELCKMPVAKDFEDLYHWMPKEQVEALEAAYEDVDDVDLMAGIIAEEPMEGAVMGPTLACIMTEQLLRWRRADRFWFENTVHPGALTPEQLHEVRKFSMAKLICDHGDSVNAVQPRVVFLPGPGNEFIHCSKYPKIDYNAWKDLKCAPQHQHSYAWYHTLI